MKWGLGATQGGADRAEWEFERPDWGRVQGRQDVPGHLATRRGAAS
jgi:hypothetical protein